MKHCIWFLDRHRFKDLTDVTTEGLLSSDLEKLLPTKVSPNIGKFKYFYQDSGNAKQPSTALIRDSFVMNGESEFMESQFEIENFKLLCINQK